MTEKDIAIDEDALFDDAVTDVPADQQDQPDAPADQDVEPQQLRDEAGRFAAKEEPEPGKPEASADDRIPQWRREEIAAEKNRAVDEARLAREEAAREREARAALEQRLKAMEKPAAAEKQDDEPDPLLDPKGFREHVQRQIREEMLNDRREQSLLLAHRTHKEEFTEAYGAAQQAMAKGDRALAARMQESRDPGEALIQWHREQKTMREVGNDPNAWLEKKLEERLNDPAFLAKAIEKARGSALTTQPNGRLRVDLPPSLNGASRSNASLRSAQTDVSDDDLFEATTA